MSKHIRKDRYPHMKAYLILEDGTVFTGTSIGSEREVISEIVFNTSMTGYLEVLTDPSYAGQAVVMTYPLIGNYGICHEDMESAKPWPDGYIVRELSRIPSNFRSEDTIQNFLKCHDIPGICGIDTRALTKILREKGTMNGMITTREYTDLSGPITVSYTHLIALDYLFMFPFSMGMSGAAIATGLAPVISMGVLSLHLFSKKSTLSILRCRWSLREAISILSPGVSSFITELSSGIVLMVFNLVILSLAGNTGVAAYGIVANLALVVTAVFTGIAQGLQPLASRSYGAGDGNALKLVFRYGAMLSIVLSVCIYAGANTYWQGIIAIFNSEGSQDLVPIARRGIQLYFAGFLFAGVNIVSAAFLSAVVETGKAFCISIVRGCLAIIPLAFLLPGIWGMDGVWLSFVLAEAAACVVSAAGIMRAGTP